MMSVSDLRPHRFALAMAVLFAGAACATPSLPPTAEGRVSRGETPGAPGASITRGYIPSTDTIGKKTMKTTDQLEHDAPAKAGVSSPTSATSEVAILAGGCFWGMEELLRKEPGVLKIEVGYTG